MDTSVYLSASNQSGYKKGVHINSCSLRIRPQLSSSTLRANQPGSPSFSHAIRQVMNACVMRLVLDWQLHSNSGRADPMLPSRVEVPSRIKRIVKISSALGQISVLLEELTEA